jgi:uncharacterized membrane protein YjgN (DUF898 family)
MTSSDFTAGYIVGSMPPEFRLFLLVMGVLVFGIYWIGKEVMAGIAWSLPTSWAQGEDRQMMAGTILALLCLLCIFGCLWKTCQVTTRTKTYPQKDMEACEVI